MTTTVVPKRHEQPKEFTWDLESVYADDKAWEQDFQRLEALVDEVPQLAGTLSRDAEALLHALQQRDAASQLLQQLEFYARLRRDEDTANPTYQALADRIASLGSRLNAALAFFDPELLQIPDDRLDEFLQTNESLRLYTHALNELRRQRAHRRSMEIEAVLAAAGEVARSPGAIFSMLADADLKLPTIKDENGNDVELTKERYLRFIESQNRDVRKAAFEGLYAGYGSVRNTLATSLSSQIRANIFYAKARNYESALHAALDPDAIPLTVYTNLVETINANLHHLHRYMRLRKRMLRLDELHLYDLAAPLVPDATMRYTYDQAREIVARSCAALGQEYSSVLRHGLYEGRWVDVYENQGKRSGAYHSSAYKTHPFILMNYQENIQSIFTLAHEFGHAMHSYNTRKTQPYVYSKYTIFVAEVASTLNEALLVDYLLKTNDDRMFRLALINRQIETLRQTMFRQTMFAEFEYETHRRTEAGEAMTADSFGELSYELNKRHMGPDVVLDDQIRLEWSRIPHYYYNFYVYKYATGIAASTALARQILSKGQPAVDHYFTLLNGGNSQTSIDLLKGAGVDMRSPEPVQQACDTFGDLVTQMEQLADALESERRN